MSNSKEHIIPAADYCMRLVGGCTEGVAACSSVCSRHCVGGGSGTAGGGCCATGACCGGC